MRKPRRPPPGLVLRLAAAGLLLAACGSSGGTVSAPSIVVASTTVIPPPISTTILAATTTAPVSSAGSPTTATTPAARVAAARKVATTFVERLQAGAAKGDYASASALWSGYPGEPGERASTLKALVSRNPWLRDGSAAYDVVDAWAFTDPPQVVSIVDAKHRGALALLVDGTGTIQRIQTAFPVQLDGSRVTIPGVPVEGGVVAWYGSRRLGDDAVQPDPASDSTTIRLPAPPDPAQPALLTVSMATPELPTAVAVLVGGPAAGGARG